MMFSSYAANAVLAKSRAKYGRRLTVQQYNDLLGCHTVSELAGYLKTRTKYSKCLAGYSPETLHRGFLEICLKRYLFDEYASLYRYELSLGEKFNRYFVLRSELEQILNCLRLIVGGNPEEYLFKLPDFFNKHTSLDLYRLAEAKTFQDLLKAVEHTPYYKVLEPFASLEHAELDYAVIDSALQKYMYLEIVSAIEDGFHGSAKKALLELVGMQCDMINLTYIYRLKYIFKINNDYIRTLLLPHGSQLGEKELSILLEDASKSDFFDRLAKTPLKKYFTNWGSEYIEQLTESILFGYSTKLMRYSSKPPVVLLSFIILAEIEVANITHIIEGVRYDIPAEEISKLLIGIQH